MSKDAPKLFPAPEPGTSEKSFSEVAATVAPTQAPALTLDELLVGLTRTSCCDACNPEQGCIITRDSGFPFCAHPTRSGGLQAPHLMHPPTMKCFERAKAAIRREDANMITLAAMQKAG
jgi:hypothetical protein